MIDNREDDFMRDIKVFYDWETMDPSVRTSILEQLKREGEEKYKKIQSVEQEIEENLKKVQKDMDAWLDKYWNWAYFVGMLTGIIITTSIFLFLRGI